jgi:hypothetical protein
MSGIGRHPVCDCQRIDQAPLIQILPPVHATEELSWIERQVSSSAEHQTRHQGQWKFIGSFGLVVICKSPGPHPAPRSGSVSTG